MKNKEKNNYIYSVTLVSLFTLIALSSLYSPGTSDVKHFWLEWIKVVDSQGPISGFAKIQWDYPPFIAIIFWQKIHLAIQ